MSVISITQAINMQQLTNAELMSKIQKICDNVDFAEVVASLPQSVRTEKGVESKYQTLYGFLATIRNMIVVLDINDLIGPNELQLQDTKPFKDLIKHNLCNEVKSEVKQVKKAPMKDANHFYINYDKSPSKWASVCYGTPGCTFGDYGLFPNYRMHAMSVRAFTTLIDALYRSIYEISKLSFKPRSDQFRFQASIVSQFEAFINGEIVTADEFESREWEEHGFYVDIEKRFVSLSVQMKSVDIVIPEILDTQDGCPKSITLLQELGLPTEATQAKDYKPEDRLKFNMAMRKLFSDCKSLQFFVPAKVSLGKNMKLGLAVQGTIIPYEVSVPVTAGILEKELDISPFLYALFQQHVDASQHVWGAMESSAWPNRFKIICEAIAAKCSLEVIKTLEIHLWLARIHGEPEHKILAALEASRQTVQE